MLPVVLILAAGTMPGLAYDEETGGRRGSYEDQQACTPDVFRLCGSHIPNVSSIVNCLKSERRNLSPECRVVMDKQSRVRRVHSTN
jgi:hypothetical protein